MELKWLEDFAALATLGNFSRAAELRGVTQPAFSRRIRTLEGWVGIDLIDRTQRDFRLTAGGSEFLKGAHDLIQQTARLRRDARAAAGEERPVLRFASTHALSFTFFPRWMRDFDQAERAVAVQLSSDSMEACEEQMLLDQAHFMLCHHHPASPGRCASPAFESVTVGSDVLLPCVAVVDGDPKWSLADTAGEVPLLSYSAESGLGRILAAHRLDQRAPGLTSIFSARLAAALHEMVRVGRGIAWLPQTLVQGEIADGHITRAGGADWDIPLEIRLTRSDRPQTAVADAFWTAAVERHRR